MTGWLVYSGIIFNEIKSICTYWQQSSSQWNYYLISFMGKADGSVWTCAIRRVENSAMRMKANQMQYSQILLRGSAWLRRKLDFRKQACYELRIASRPFAQKQCGRIRYKLSNLSYWIGKISTSLYCHPFENWLFKLFVFHIEDFAFDKVTIIELYVYRLK